MMRVVCVLCEAVSQNKVEMKCIENERSLRVVH